MKLTALYQFEYTIKKRDSIEYSDMSLKIRYQALLILSYMVSLAPLAAADTPARNIRIAEVHYQSDGNTSAKALNRTLDWDYRRIFSTPYELNDYLQQKRQLLINKKVYRSVLTDYSIIGKEGNITLVNVSMKLKEAWTIIPIPYYKYDDNLGAVMGLGLDYTNVAGSLTDLHFSSYYSSVKSEILTDWNSIRIGSLFMNLHYRQLWETVKTADSDGDVNLEYSYVQSSVSLSMDVPIVHELNYIASPIIRWPYSYKFTINNTDKSNGAYMYKGAVPAYNHILKWDNVDWIGSLRSGFGATVENQLEFDQVAEEFITWADGIFTAFVYTPFISYNTRVSGFFYHNDFRRNAADRLRGVLDYKLSGITGFYWNQNTPFNIMSLPKVGDIQLSPFFDMGFVLDKGETLDRSRMRLTAGTSLILFPALLPSFSFSAEFGINLGNTEETEIRLSSILFY